MKINMKRTIYTAGLSAAAVSYTHLDAADEL